MSGNLTQFYTYIYTHRDLYIYLSDCKFRILHSSPLLNFLTDLLTKRAVAAPKSAILLRAADLKPLFHRATP